MSFAQRKVLFFAPSAYVLGGLATWLSYLASGLEAKGMRVRVALTSGDWHDYQKYCAAYPMLKTVELRGATGTEEGRRRAITQLVLSEQPDVVLGVNMPDVYPAVAALRHAGQSSARVAMTIHGVQPDLFEDAARNRDTLDSVVCTNALACELAREASGQRELVLYAPYGVTIPESSRDSSRTTDDVLRIAYVGRIEDWQKRTQDVCAIVEGLSARGLAYELWVAGAGPDEEKMRARLEPLTRAGKVRWLGQLSQGDVAERVYKKCDVLLLTSCWETGPIVAWEAMAHRLVLVSSRYIGSGREAALHHEENCLLFDVGHCDAAMDCLLSLVDAKRRERLSAAGHDLVATRYSIERSVAQWHAQIERIASLLPRKPSPAPLPAASGRLDRWLGVTRAETLRERLKMRFRHREPGGEWPHSYGTRSIDDAEFWIKARALDAVAQGVAST